MRRSEKLRISRKRRGGTQEDGGGSRRKESKLETNDSCRYEMQKFGKMIVEATTNSLDWPLYSLSD
jgi:hypothetical protein